MPHFNSMQKIHLSKKHQFRPELTMTYCSTTKRWHRGTVAKLGATPIKMLLLHAQTLKQHQDSTVNMVLRLRTGQLKNHASIPGNDERFLLSKLSRLGLRPSQIPI
jgi:hypothetical protein